MGYLYSPSRREEVFSETQHSPGPAEGALYTADRSNEPIAAVPGSRN